MTHSLLVVDENQLIFGHVASADQSKLSSSFIFDFHILLVSDRRLGLAWTHLINILGGAFGSHHASILCIL